MTSLPTGTVTFLFTDIEGSTRLLEEHGERYAELLAEHRRVVREACTRHGGVEVDTQGDAFFVAFARASDAIAAADEAQRELDLPVRMGIHTGEPTLTPDGYVGMDVHRAARICAAAHGRQVLVSQSTRDLAASDLRDLGEYRLKDLGAPLRLFQLGARKFPSPRSLNQTNLPAQASPLVGRGRELAELVPLVENERLVTLAGPGGSGKTRLALQVAAEVIESFEGGVFWVPLASVTDPELVTPALARAVGASGPVADHVGERSMLLLLDNLEQVIEAAPSLSELLERCPNLHLLVTSRVLLRIAGERDYPIEPLTEEDAVMLFTERAAVAEPLEAVHDICRRLDRLPLAVELAAARTRLLPPDKLLERLDRILPVLVSGRRDAPERQRTLRATIEWSHDLLAEPERALFRRLGVFAGSFTLEAAEEVCGADLDTLESLLDNSLLHRWASGRVGMLETIGEFAKEELEESGEQALCQERVYDYLLALVPASSDVAAHAPQVLEQLGAELANIRAALTWALEADPRRCLELAVALGRFWVIRDAAEGDRWLTDALSATIDPPLELRAEALLWAGSCRWFTWDHVATAKLLEESLALFRELGDARRIADALDRVSGVRIMLGKREDARAAAAESLALCEQLGDRRQTMYALSKLGQIAWQEGDATRARETEEQVLALGREFGDSWWTAGSLATLAYLALEGGDVARAADLCRESTTIRAELEDRLHLMDSFGLLASIAALRGQPAAAGRFWGAVEALELEGHRLAPDEKARYESWTAEAEGPEFAAAVEGTRALSTDEAVDAALAEID